MLADPLDLRQEDVVIRNIPRQFLDVLEVLHVSLPGPRSQSCIRIALN
jgi:hypothetical protein